MATGRLRKLELLHEIVEGVARGDVIPYLGPGALADVVHAETGAPIPADSESLILAMNGGQPMAPKLMYEFPRAAMNLELKKGRAFITKFLTGTYGETPWTRGEVHAWLASHYLPYVVDVNRDTQLIEAYASRPHVLVVGVARIGGTDYRFKIFRNTEEGYREIGQDEVTDSDPVLFKPLGTPVPEPNYIASDADFVDYITELMGGFAIPRFIKERRVGKQYALLGLRLERDTERMVLSDVLYGAAEQAGWALIEKPSAKERRFCETKHLEVIESSPAELLAMARALAAAGSVPGSAE